MCLFDFLFLFLQLRNIYTSHVSQVAAKQLQTLAGASSLSMKPPLSLLTHSPVLVLGVEGPSHSFVRFKSFSATARSAVQLWKLSGHNLHVEGGARHHGHSEEEAAVSLSAGVAGEWGVLASSSTRLAKDLYKHCFADIYGSDSEFSIV